MPTRDGHARWEGSLQEGSGTARTGSGSFEGSYSAASRFENGEGTNPEELIAAAHAACFSMALAGDLAGHGHEPTSIETTAKVSIVAVDGGFEINRIELVTVGDVPGIDTEHFREHAETAKQGCPVSKALAGPEITVEATLAA